jgi:hypothetical protein
MAPIATVPVVSPLRNWRRDDSAGAFAALVFAFSSLFFFSTFGLSGYLETVLNFSNNLNVWGRPSEKTVYVVLADFQPLLAVRRAICLLANGTWRNGTWRVKLISCSAISLPRSFPKMRAAIPSHTTRKWPLLRGFAGKLYGKYFPGGV